MSYGCSGFTFKAVCPECVCVVADSAVFSPGELGQYDGPPESCYPADASFVENVPESCPNCGLVLSADELLRQGEVAYGEWLEIAAEDAASARWEDKYDR